MTDSDAYELALEWAIKYLPKSESVETGRLISAMAVGIMKGYKLAKLETAQ